MVTALIPCTEIKKKIRNLTKYNRKKLPLFLTPIRLKIASKYRNRENLIYHFRSVCNNRRIPFQVVVSREYSSLPPIIDSDFVANRSLSLGRVDIQEFIGQLLSSILDQFVGEVNNFRTRRRIITMIENELNGLAELGVIASNPRVSVESGLSQNMIDLVIDIVLIDGRILRVDTRTTL